MIKQLFKRGDAVRRQLAAPLASSRVAYLKHCAEQGAKPSTLGNVACTLAAVAEYLGLGEQGMVRLSELEAAAERWVCQDPRRRGGNRETARQRFLRHGPVGCDSPAVWKLLRPRSRLTLTSARSSSTTCGGRWAGRRPPSAPTARGRKSS